MPIWKKTPQVSSSEQHAEPTPAAAANGPALPVLADGIEDDSGFARFDKSDMTRLGKKQEYARNFGFTATLGLASVFSLTWEYVLISTTASLTNGGFSGAIWEYLWTGVGYFTIVASLAEMASMAPTAGGQYHWTSEFAPARLQKPLSYLSGWTSAIAWQPALAGGLYPLVTMLGAARTYFDPNFAFTNWQASLLMIAIGFTSVPLNSVWRKALPAFEMAALALHCLGFFAVLIPLWVLAPKNDTSEVFGNIQNNGGWSSTGLSLLVGQAAMLYTMAGPDSAVHMAEEVRDAAINVPRAMVWSFVINNILGFVILITMCFCIGDLQGAINSDEPFIVTFMNGTGTPGGALALTVILAVLMFVSNSTALATQSRQLWAFARDRGMPFSTWMAAIHPRWKVPLNSIWVSMGVNIILSLINLGSNLAFNIIISINLVGCLLTYLVSIGCLLSARWRGQKLPPARWSLGRLGAPINVFAFFYACFMTIFSLFPVSEPVTPLNMNWAIVVVGFVLLVSLVFYIFQGRKVYSGPVAYVEGQRMGMVMQTTKGDEYMEDY